MNRARVRLPSSKAFTGNGRMSIHMLIVRSQPHSPREKSNTMKERESRWHVAPIVFSNLPLVFAHSHSLHLLLHTHTHRHIHTLPIHLFPLPPCDSAPAFSLPSSALTFSSFFSSRLTFIFAFTFISACCCRRRSTRSACAV